MNQGVLKLAVNGRLDLERIARDLLDTHPGIFISLAEKQVQPEVRLLAAAKMIAAHIRDDHLFDAIKSLRWETNLSLKDAKDVVFSVAKCDPQIKDLAPNLQGYATQIRKEL